MTSDIFHAWTRDFLQRINSFGRKDAESVNVRSHSFDSFSHSLNPYIFIEQ